jgi:glycosyltransferase involved in cell wall biosynthesis
MGDPIANVRASVIICAYNRAAQAKECLDSVLAWEFDIFEIVIVDDAFTDSTPEHVDRFRQTHREAPIPIGRAVCEELNAELPWPVRYEIEPRRGIPFARNRAVACVVDEADFVAFIDDYEEPMPSWLEASL